MNVVGLFAGIGGLELGLAKAGHRAVLLSEILPTARHVLSARLPDVDLRGDIVQLRDLPSDVDIVTAGFPCQDLSQAGLTAGLDGARSGLVGEVFRLIRRRPPRWLVLENVPFMLQLRRGDAMRRIVDALEDMGFRWAWRIVDTYGFGIPQRRERVILVASRCEDPAGVLFADDRPLDRPTSAIGRIAHGFYWTEGRGGLGWAPDAIPTLKNGSSIGIPSPPAILMPDGRIVKPDIRDAERLQGFPADWTNPAENVARPSARWTLVGNAVSVPVAEWIGRRLTDPGQPLCHVGGPLPSNGALPRAAWFDGRKRRSVAIGADPLGIRPPPLALFLAHPGTPLSERATSGFLSRAYKAKLRFAPGFLEAVEAHLARMRERAQSPEKRVA